MDRRGEAGITLVEIMVSIVLLGIVLTAFLRVMTGGLRSLSDSGARQESSQMSTEALEELRALTPSEIGMFVDPLLTDPAEVDIAAISTCTAQIDDDGDGTVDRTPPGYDPDDSGPIPCEEIITRSLGGITSTMPFNGTSNGTIITTVATAAQDPGLIDGVVRVTSVTVYDLPGGAETVRRQALFSEVSRG